MAGDWALRTNDIWRRAIASGESEKANLDDANAAFQKVVDGNRARTARDEGAGMGNAGAEIAVLSRRDTRGKWKGKKPLRGLFSMPEKVTVSMKQADAVDAEGRAIGLKSESQPVLSSNIENALSLDHRDDDGVREDPSSSDVSSIASSDVSSIESSNTDDDEEGRPKSSSGEKEEKKRKRKRKTEEEKKRQKKKKKKGKKKKEKKEKKSKKKRRKKKMKE